MPDMHELSVTKDILEIILKYAAANAVTSVKTITLEVGELSDLEGEWLQWYFDMTAQGTVAAGARLVIGRVPARMGCGGCGAEFVVDFQNTEHIVCPSCGSRDVRLVSGTEYTVKSMEAV